MAVAAKRGLKIWQMDVVTAYLLRFLDKKVYIRQPTLMEDDRILPFLRDLHDTSDRFLCRRRPPSLPLTTSAGLGTFFSGSSGPAPTL